MILRLVLGILIAMTMAMALNYGDNGQGYPHLSDYSLGYYEVNYSQALFNSGTGLSLCDSVGLKYQFSDELLLSLEKKYISNKLALGIHTKIYGGTDIGQLGIGIRNLGMTYADTNSPYAQEYLSYSFDQSKVKVSLGLQRLVTNGSPMLDLFGGAKTNLMNNVDLDVFFENRNIGIGVSFPWDERLKVSLVGMAPAPNQPVGDFRNIELTFTWQTQPARARSSIDSFGGRVPLEGGRSREQERQISLLNARVSAVEYIYSQTFQLKLIDELLSQRLMDRRLNEDETDRLKETLQHIQKGFEFYYLRDYKKAYDEYKMANSIYPNLPVVHASLGSLQLAMGRFEEAKQEWLLWLSLAPDSEDAKKNLTALQKDHPDLFLPTNRGSQK